MYTIIAMNLRLQVLNESIENNQMNHGQFLQGVLQVMNVLLSRRLEFRVLLANSGIQLPKIVPALIQAQRRVKFQSPELDTAREHRRVILGKGVVWDRLFRWDVVECLAKMVDCRQWDIIDPSLSTF